MRPHPPPTCRADLTWLTSRFPRSCKAHIRFKTSRDTQTVASSQPAPAIRSARRASPVRTILLYSLSPSVIGARYDSILYSLL
eukprot:25378-Prorocentrum_minimum.AAC.2